MTLRRKILLILVGVFVALIVLLYIAADQIAFRTLQRLEEQSGIRNVTRVAQTLENERINLRNSADDYGKWDETYQFFDAAYRQTLDQTALDYQASNLSLENMRLLRLNLMLGVHSSGQILVQHALDLVNGSELPIPATFFEQSYPSLLQPTAANQPKVGIIAYGDGLMLVASHPVLSHSEPGLNRGSLIFGRYIDDEFLQHIASLTLLDVAIYPINDRTQWPSAAQANQDAINATDAIVLKSLSADVMAGYQRLMSVDGAPVALLEVTMPRSIQQQGAISLNYLVAILVALIIVFGIVVSYVMESMVLSPVTELRRYVSQIGASANLSTRLPVTGKDELTAVAQNINQMLDALENAQQAQRRTEARYRAIFEQASEGIVFADAHTHQLIAANAAFQQLTGYTANEIANLAVYDIVMTGETAYTTSLDHISAPQRFAVTEHTYRRKDGALINVEASAVLLPVDNEQAIYCMVVRDITERKQAETRLRQTQKLESLGLLAGGIAHDFNNLLTGMLGQTSLALDKIAPEHPAWLNIDKAVISARRAADLTRQLLAYAGRGQFQVEPLDLNQLIRENASLLETILTSQARLHLVLAPDLCLIAADRGQIQQIVMNLVINATEAITTESGDVTVTTFEETLTLDHTKQYVGGDSLPPGRYVCLKVSDTGTGIDSEILAHIFDPFFTTKLHGTGLGLSATVGIVRTHKGGLQVTSQVGQGTTFKILFPALGPAPIAPIVHHSMTNTAEHNPVVRGAVLVIDDEKSVREVVCDILEMNGLEVLVAHNGQVGVEIFTAQQNKIDVVLLDMQMPVMNGAETFQALRAIDPNVKVILSSGYNEIEATGRFVDQGLAAFLQKPYDLDTLVAKVRSVLISAENTSRFA